MHELATNAQKYGGLSEGSGGVRVSWELDETDGSRVFVFHWEETGVPADAALDEPDDEGFGTRLLMTIVPTMLQGTAERGVVDGTLRYTLRMPADALKPDVSWQQGSGMAAEIVDAEFAAGPA